MATTFRFEVNGVSKDPDVVFKARGGASPRANIPIWKGQPPTAQNWSDRYYPAAGGDTPSGSSNVRVKVGGSYVDVLTLFRDINYTPPPPPPSASVGGASSVLAGGGGGGSWSWSVSAAAGIKQYRVYVPGHGGTWTVVNGSISSDSGTITWSSPMGNPDFSHTPGSYSWEVEVVDMLDRSASASHPFTVV
jgi:hypothetical protein